MEASETAGEPQGVSRTMVSAVVGWSLRFRLLIAGIAAGLIVVGVVQLRSAPVDVLPEFTPPYVEIQTESLGLSAEEVEQFITVPLEANLLNGVEGVEVIRSESVPGLSSITLVFEPGFDLYTGRALVQERLTQVGAGALPNISSPPLMLPPLSSSSRALIVGLSSEELSRIEQSVLARWTVRPRLMGVPGVANVSIWGMRDQQLQVQVDPDRLREQNITLSDVVETAGNAQIASPLTFIEASTPGTGGFIETPQQRLQVQNIFDRISTPEGLGKVPVEGTGGSLRLADVARVVEDHQPLIGDAIVNGGEGVMLVVEKFPGASALEVTEGVEAALDKLGPGLTEVKTETSLLRPAGFIEDAIDNLTLALVIAGVLVLLVLVAFLMQWRALAVGLASIVFSLVAAALVLDLLGETFNAISFAGLAAAVAIVIDEAVVGTEAMVRGARRWRAAGGKGLPAELVVEASAQVRGPLVYATLITLLAIVPLAVMEGRPGAFFEPLTLAYGAAVVTAVAAALILTPALGLLLLSPARDGAGEPTLARRLRSRYESLLSRFTAKPRAAVICAGILALVGLATLPLLDASPIPSFKDRDVLVRLEGAPGTSQPRMTNIATEVSESVREVPGVNGAGAHVGRAVSGDRVVDVNTAEVWVAIDPEADYDATMEAVNGVADEVEDAENEVITNSSEAIREVGGLDHGENSVTGSGLDLLTGSERPLAVRVYGQSLGALQREAERVAQVMSTVEGVVDPRVDVPESRPTVEVEVDLEDARRYGVKPGDVRRAQAIQVQGIQVGSVFEEQKVFDVIVQGTPQDRRSVTNLASLPIDRPDGGRVRLSQVADVRRARAPVTIERDAVSRHIDVEAGVAGRSVDEVATELEERLASLTFPLEYHAEVLNTSTAEEVGNPTMIAAGVGVVLAALLLLQAALGSWGLALLVLVTLPVALAGGVLGALVEGAELSLGAMIGLLAVLGLAVRAELLLLRRLQDLKWREEGTFGAPQLLEGAGERSAALLTSAAAIAAAVLPFAILGDRPGLEILNPMAMVVLGGLITTVFVSAFLLPALYVNLNGTRWGDREAKEPGSA